VAMYNKEYKRKKQLSHSSFQIHPLYLQVRVRVVSHWLWGLVDEEGVGVFRSVSHRLLKMIYLF
jgi:hypothetical protein